MPNGLGEANTLTGDASPTGFSLGGCAECLPHPSLLHNAVNLLFNKVAHFSPKCWSLVCLLAGTELISLWFPNSHSDARRFDSNSVSRGSCVFSILPWIVFRCWLPSTIIFSFSAKGYQDHHEVWPAAPGSGLIEKRRKETKICITFQKCMNTAPKHVRVLFHIATFNVQSPVIQAFRLFGKNAWVSISIRMGFRVWKLSTSLETLLKRGFSLHSAPKCLRGDWNAEGGLAVLVPLAKAASFSLCKAGVGGMIGSNIIANTILDLLFPPSFAFYSLPPLKIRKQEWHFFI